MAELPTLHRLDELTYLLEHDLRVYLRYSPGPEADAGHPSKDHESGLLMPGVSANPLWPPHWWTRPPADWVARKVCQYLRELHEGARPWVLTGREIDFGPDNEPLLVDLEPIAWLSADLVREAQQRYQAELNAGQATHAG
ncbi:DUF6098 family protein [Actinophytocola sp.]|uniref:DUF6098 family protein n=1 Tax=Actinophytocola sp. TaxID=1872138 RepID=UPI00389AC889